MPEYTNDDLPVLGDMVDLARRHPQMFLRTLPPERQELAEILEWEAHRMGASVQVKTLGRLTVIHGSPDWLDPANDDPRWSRAAFPQGGQNAFRPSFVLPAFASTIATVAPNEGVVLVVGTLDPKETDALREAIGRGQRLLAFAL